MTIRKRPRTKAQFYKRNRFQGLQDDARRIVQARDELDVRIEMRDQDIRAWHGEDASELSTAEICEATGLPECDVLSILLGGTP